MSPVFCPLPVAGGGVDQCNLTLVRVGDKALCCTKRSNKKSPNRFEIKTGIEMLQNQETLKKSLSQIIEKYGAFEADVRAYTTKIHRHHCSACRGACCEPKYCQESLTSPFLVQLRQHFAPEAVYDARRGWLTSNGCALPVGRPPVCHQFYCAVIFDHCPTAEFRYAILVLSNLVAHVGKRVAGRMHIVELEDFSGGVRINLMRFKKQLNEAADAFQRVCAYLDGNAAELNPCPILKKICPPPSDSVRW